MGEVLSSNEHLTRGEGYLREMKLELLLGEDIYWGL